MGSRSPSRVECAMTHRATADEGLNGAHEPPLQVREPRHVRRHALPRYPQQLAVHKLHFRTLRCCCDADSDGVDCGFKCYHLREIELQHDE